MVSSYEIVHFLFALEIYKDHTQIIITIATSSYMCMSKIDLSERDTTSHIYGMVKQHTFK